MKNMEAMGELASTSRRGRGSSGESRGVTAFG